MNYVSNYYTVKELKEIAKEYNLKRYSTLNKAALIDFINEHVRDCLEGVHTVTELEVIEAEAPIEADVEVPTLVEEPKDCTESELTLAVLLVIIDQALDFTYDYVVVPLAKVAYQILLSSYTLWRKARARRLVNNL